MTTVSPARALRTLELELNAQDYLRRFRAVGASPSALELLARCRAAPRSVPPQAEPIRTGYLLRADPADWDSADGRLQRLLHGLRAALAPVQKHLVGVWLHGSLATQDYTGYSDVDALIVLRDEAVQDPRTYRRMRTAVLRALRSILVFDPLQHHGFFAGTESLLDQWPSDYLPGAALQYARPLWPLPASVALQEHSDPLEAPAAFHTLCRQVLHAQVPRTLYQAKSLLSQFMLLPAAYYQAIGQPVYKRESFPQAQAEFPAHWCAMDEATQLRAEWRVPRRAGWAICLMFANPWVASRLYRRLERAPVPKRYYDNWPAFIQEMQELGRAMEARLPAVRTLVGRAG